MTVFFKVIRTVFIVLIILLLVYKQFESKDQQTDHQKQVIKNNAYLVKGILLKYKKPQRIEIQNFIKSEKSKFTNDIQEIKNIKTFLNPDSNFYIELQLFTDEADSTAPLVVQLRFLDIKSKNLIQEKSINLY